MGNISRDGLGSPGGADQGPHLESARWFANDGRGVDHLDGGEVPGDRVVTGEGLVFKLGHKAVAPEKGLGDHLLISPVGDLSEEAIELEFTLKHLVQGALKHDRAGIFRIIEHWLLAASEVYAPGRGEIVET